MMVSMTIAWLRLECAFSLVNANTLWAVQQGESQKQEFQNGIPTNTETAQTHVTDG